MAAVQSVSRSGVSASAVSPLSPSRQSDVALPAVASSAADKSSKNSSTTSSRSAGGGQAAGAAGAAGERESHEDEEITRAEIEARAQAISRNVRCLTCANQSIDESQSDIAVLLRRLIRDELGKGKTEQQVYQKLTEDFGETVLYKPPFNAQTAILWLLPAVCMAGAAGLSWIARRRASRRLLAAPNLFPNLPLTAAERECLAKLIEPPSIARRRREWLPCMFHDDDMAGRQFKICEMRHIAKDPGRFKPTWKTKRPKDAIPWDKERKEGDAKREARREVADSTRRRLLKEQHDYTGFNIINGEIYDGSRIRSRMGGKKMRPVTSPPPEKIAEMEQRAEERRASRRESLMAEGIVPGRRKSAVKDNFNPYY
ncbi:hypothetical protein CBR_g32010 [Chara braunii]|uniref:Cytochrome c-type biogenesis protein n=1 Tax=Chara braunii TaxID=69332 RepID=A0A388LG94_CHABU|nr:hypothetical protein CBR_g32010 [Chara braunii]|eukprot:GBG81336.1 hypothetical protein CBR_g32010 [Chara braunii]